MKKVLILWASEKSAPTSPEHYTKHEATALVTHILKALSIPFDTGWSSVVPTSDASKYALVIIPEMRNNMPSLFPWAGGALSTPVLVTDASWVENKVGWVSGATAWGTQATTTSLTTPWGLIGYYAGAGIYTMDAADTGVTKLMYNDDGKCVFWKRRGAAGDVYFWSKGDATAIPLTHVLAQVYTAGEVLYPIFPNIDHPEEADIDKLTGCISWLRARGAVCAVGIRTEYWHVISASMKALLRDNQDVLIPQVHSHGTSEYLFSDDVTFPTVAAKVAEYRRQRGVLEVDGINTADNGSLGFQCLPDNLVSVLGTEAMANLGITAWRACTPGHPWAKEGNNPVTLHKVGGEVLRVVGRANTQAALWTANTLAAEYAHKGVDNIHSYRAVLQNSRWSRYIFRFNAPIVYIHGVNNLQGENPGQMFFDVFDTVVKAGSPIIRWSTREDLANMADLYGRRTRWR